MRFFDLTNRPSDGELPAIPVGRRAQTVQRLQIGITGVAMMLLLVGLASIVQDRARSVDAAAVPEAAATVEPDDAEAKSDPLVETGVIPDLSEGEGAAGDSGN